MKGQGRLVALAVAAIALASTQHVSAKSGDKSHHDQVQPAPPYAPYGPLSRDSCYRSENHDTADLCAQWRAAVAAEKAASAAKESVTWTIVGTILSFAALGALLWTLRQTERALAEAKRGNEITASSQRAWIRLAAKPQLVQPKGVDGLYMRVDFIAENIGESRATHFIFFHTILFRWEAETDPITERMKAKVREWKERNNAKPNWTLPPKDSVVDGDWRTFTAEEIKWDRTLGGEFAQPMLMAAVMYRTLDKPSLIQVDWRSWYLCTVGGSGHVEAWLTKSKNDLGPNDLAVEHFHIGMVHEEYAAEEHGSE
jgi:hypothetical protein